MPRRPQYIVSPMPSLMPKNDAGEASAHHTETEHVAEAAQISSEDEDYDPEADVVELWDDYVDDLYAEVDVVRRNNPNGWKDTDY
ncbi:hypothetical protein AHAS_Ahas19G0263500 [Arachis hypogaea]